MHKKKLSQNCTLQFYETFLKSKFDYNLFEPFKLIGHSCNFQINEKIQASMTSSSYLTDKSACSLSYHNYGSFKLFYTHYAPHLTH